ncbi:MAG: PhoU domain-containing protein [Candidatus Hermodarchaeia archaeon]|jgi:phosphate uptake regulator
MEKDLGYRRIQRTGRGSYIVSLPKEWVLDSDLKKGSQLAFKILDDSSLLLVPRHVLEQRTEMKSTLNEFTIHVTHKDDPRSIDRRLKSLYVVSAHVIHIRFQAGGLTPQQKNGITSTVRMLLGSEIISETSNEISIQVLINHPEFPLEKAIRRMLAIATIMDRNAISTLTNFDESLINDVIASDSDLDRLNLYVIRQLKFGIERNMYQEMGFRSPKEFLGYRIVTKNLENVGDNAVGTAKNILALKQMIDQGLLYLRDPIDEEVYTGVLEFTSFCRRLLEDSLKALFKRDYQIADEIISRFMSSGLNLEKEAVNLMLSKTMDPNVTSVIRLVLDNARKMMEYGRDIAEVTLNRTVEEISTS